VDILDPGQQAQNPGVIPVREQILGGYEYRGYAYAQLEALERDRLETGAPMLSDNLRPADGVEIYIRASKYGHLIRITESDTGFICHPRDNTNPGGAKPGGVAVTPTSYQYPLVDDDHASSVLSWDGETWAVSSEVENYGNLDWKGPDGETLSWRGPCGRQFAMDSTANYPGFTAFDYLDGSEVEHYTPYQRYVYQSGESLKEFPEGTRVLGCGLNGGILVCVVSVDYSGRTNPDGGTGGFYDEVWRGDTRIGWATSSRPSVPWFFNSTGTEAVCGQRKLSIAEDSSVTFSTLSAGSGTETVQYAKGENSEWSLAQSGLWALFRDYIGQDMAGIELAVSSAETSAHTGESSETHADLPVKWSCPEDPEGVIIGSDTVTVGAGYSVSLSSGELEVCTDISWSFDGGTISSDGVVTAITGCGSGTITATYNGKCGGSLNLSKTVRLPSGKWIAEYYAEQFEGLQPGWLPDPVITYFGEYRISVTWRMFSCSYTGAVPDCTCQRSGCTWCHNCYTGLTCPSPAAAGGFPMGTCPTAPEAGFPYITQPAIVDVMKWVCP
jgi:hypothetical protein